MNTTTTKKQHINRKWHLIDLKEQTLGRASTKIAQLLIGKHKTYYAPNMDCGDYVVVINASLVNVTGKKRSEKLYRHHTGYPGGFREYTFDQVQSKDARKIISHSIKGMLPKNKLRDKRMKRLKVFTNADHPYKDQISNNTKASK